MEEPEGLRWFNEAEIADYKDINPFHNAWPYSPTQPDVIGVGMPKGKTSATEDLSAINTAKSLAELSVTDMAALAGASKDGKYVQQIGIDVLPEYRGCGYATMLVAILKQRILSEGGLPFYGTAESHAISRMTGVKAGFLPAFAELFVGKKEVYDPDRDKD